MKHTSFYRAYFHSSSAISSCKPMCCDQISHSSQKYESAHVRLRARASRLTYFPGLYIYICGFFPLPLCFTVSSPRYCYIVNKLVEELWQSFSFWIRSSLPKLSVSYLSCIFLYYPLPIISRNQISYVNYTRLSKYRDPNYRYEESACK